MKVTLYSEPSIDGYIATKNNDTSWVFAVDSGKFNKFITSSDVIIMGRQTFKFAEKDSDFPYKGSYNVVITSKEDLLRRPESNKYLFTNEPLKVILQNLENKGYKKIGIIGGGRLNGSMINENLIDEIVLIYHPIILGDGVKLFEKTSMKNNFKLISIKKLGQNLVEIKYQKINKN